MKKMQPRSPDGYHEWIHSTQEAYMHHEFMKILTIAAFIVSVIDAIHLVFG
jgi:hypothetical protein